ncbi:MAG: DEAD/DEAH box helicase [Steroidobacteraceae bacterium]
MNRSSWRCCRRKDEPNVALLGDIPWRIRYTPDDADLVKQFYVPALSCAVRYDRLTGYFSARALTLAARGIEHLLANGGRMRLIIGCTLDEAEVAAIEKGEQLRERVQAHLLRLPLTATTPDQMDALELLAWMVAHGHLEAKVAVPCDERRRPIAAEAIFHEKCGVFEDKTGDRVAFNGSLNETEAGWTRNWESLNVFRSWIEPERVEEEERNFARLWAGQARRAITLDVPEAVQQDLLRFLPESDQPRRLPSTQPMTDFGAPAPEPPPESAPVASDELRRQVWAFIREAPRLVPGGERVGETTAAVTPWPHQVRAFDRLYSHWPPRLLIADEVGLGKTIQAGLLLRQVILAGRAQRVLVMAPRSVCRQWQVELREKFNLNWPIYDGRRLIWQHSPLHPAGREQEVGRTDWHREPAVIVSSHLLRRRDRAAEVLGAERWDLIVLDEAHHARRRGGPNPAADRPNALLALMRRLSAHTAGLVLLTATPMQVHPVEVWDLLALLGLPPAWDAGSFLRFFELVTEESPAAEAIESIAALAQAADHQFSPLPEAWFTARLPGTSTLRLRRVLRALRDPAATPRRMLEADDRRLMLQMAKRSTPVARLVSRHTRELLRRYYHAGLIDTRIADRRVEDVFVVMSAGERALYEALERYISTTYNQASEKERNAVGFVMTIYRRRLASSVRALALTLEHHLANIDDSNNSAGEDEDWDDLQFGDVEPDEAEQFQQQALALEERGDIEQLLRQARDLPADSKQQALLKAIADLRERGYQQVMVFTQYTDTLDALRERLARDTDLRLMCFSGRGGEIPGLDGSWRAITRDEAKRRFRQNEADVMLCTDAAAEGLNFQFCGALINYDMPWNPMRVEQRIGRIDRLGQRHPEIRIVNLHYEDTVETDVYHALRDRIGLFESVVGRLQPILASLPGRIAQGVLAGAASSTEGRQRIAADVDVAVADVQASRGFDLDEVTDADLV